MFVEDDLFSAMLLRIVISPRVDFEFKILLGGMGVGKPPGQPISLLIQSRTV